MWKCVSCAVQGKGHKRDDIPCQDMTYELVQNGVHVIVLADGAGSARFSHYGAQRLVKEASEYLVNHFEDCINCENLCLLKRTIIDFLVRALKEESQIRGCSIHDLASTLLIAAVDETRYFLLHIGDGVIGCLDAGKLEVASTPDNGEFANVTTFVTSENAISSMRLFRGDLNEKNAFVLMSDGTGHSLYHKSTKTLANVVMKLMFHTCTTDRERMKEQLEEAVTSVISQKTLDDCSIAIIARYSSFFGSIKMIPLEKRLELYEISPRDPSVRKRVECLDAILAVAETPCSLRKIAQEIHLKTKYAQKRVEKLVALGLLVKKGGFYQRF